MSVTSTLHVLIDLIFVRWALIFQFCTLGNWGTENSGNLPNYTTSKCPLERTHLATARNKNISSHNKSYF